MAKSGNVVPTITKAEHIGPDDTGDNIEAKRVAGYVWDPTLGAAGEWKRNENVVTATDLDIRNLSSASDSVEVKQATHDNLNLNANVQVANADVSDINPIPITGTVTATGAALDIVEALNVTAYDLNAAPYSGTTAISTDYVASHIELNFTTAQSKTITVTTETGTVLRNITSNTNQNINIDLGDRGFNANEEILVTVTQTAGACLMDLKLVIKRGSLALTGNPVLAESTATIGTVRDFLIEVSKGNITGHRIERVLGRNSDVDITEEDIWFNGGTLVYLSSAERMNIVSSSVNDTSAGTGARTLKIYGLNGSYAETEETITMNGTTNVLTTNSYLRVNKLEVITAGSSEVTAGTITTTAQTAGTIQITIPAGENRSGKSHYTVPASKTAYLLDFLPSSAAGKVGADVIFKVRPFGEVFKMISRIAIQETGTSAINHNLVFGPPKFTEKSDIKVTAVGSANDQDIYCEYILLVVDN